MQILHLYNVSIHIKFVLDKKIYLYKRRFLNIKKIFNALRSYFILFKSFHKWMCSKALKSQYNLKVFVRCTRTYILNNMAYSRQYHIIYNVQFTQVFLWCKSHTIIRIVFFRCIQILCKNLNHFNYIFKKLHQTIIVYMLEEIFM